MCPIQYPYSFSNQCFSTDENYIEDDFQMFKCDNERGCINNTEAIELIESGDLPTAKWRKNQCNMCPYGESCILKGSNWSCQDNCSNTETCRAETYLYKQTGKKHFCYIDLFKTTGLIKHIVLREYGTPNQVQLNYSDFDKLEIKRNQIHFDNEIYYGSMITFEFKVSAWQETSNLIIF